MIRQLVTADSKDYHRTRLLGLSLHPEAFGTGARDWEKATDEQVQALLASSSADDVVLGAFDGAELTGVVGLKREKKYSVAHKGTIWGFFVHPDRRNRGVGKALLRALVELAARNEELDYLRALVTTSCASATRAFEAVGFSHYGLERGGVKVDAQRFDQAYLRRDLR